MQKDRCSQWDLRHAAAEDIGTPAPVLQENLHLLPKSGDALDLACGRGANALLLADAGLRVTAWDFSATAIERLTAEVARRGIANLRPVVRDVVTRPPETGSFDVITVGYFLERDLVPALIHALRPGGLIYYQTFTRIAVTEYGPSNPRYRLADNELLGLFSGLKIRVYREEARLGDLARGCRDVAMLVGEKAA